MLAHPQRRLHFFLVACALLSACANGQDDFTSGLVDDPCNSNIPVCNDVVGCDLTNDSYTQGTFPGSGKFLIQTTGPATVELHFYLVDPTGGGTTTTMTWYESGCTSSFQTQVLGSVFLGEAADNNGEFMRAQALSAPGDHEITYESDATTGYFVKVVIIPTTP